MEKKIPSKTCILFLLCLSACFGKIVVPLVIELFLVPFGNHTFRAFVFVPVQRALL